MTVVLLAREPEIIAAMASELRAKGFHVEGHTAVDDAVARIESGDAAAVVIGGGVEQASLERVTAVARAHEVAVVTGRLGTRDISTYVKEELAPALHEVTASEA